MSKRRNPRNFAGSASSGFLRNPDERIRQLERQAISSGDDEDVWAYINALKRAGLFVPPEFPTGILETPYGNCEITVKNQYEVVISNKNELLNLGSFRINGGETAINEPVFINLIFTQTWSLIDIEEISTVSSLQPMLVSHIRGVSPANFDPTRWRPSIRGISKNSRWLPFQNTNRYDSYGNDLFRSNFNFTEDTIDAMNVYFEDPLLLQVIQTISNCILAWTYKHTDKLDLAASITSLNESIDYYSRYQHELMIAEMSKRSCVDRAKAWLRGKKSNQRNPSDADLRRLEREILQAPNNVDVLRYVEELARRKLLKRPSYPTYELPCPFQNLTISPIGEHEVFVKTKEGETSFVRLDGQDWNCWFNGTFAYLNLRMLRDKASYMSPTSTFLQNTDTFEEASRTESHPQVGRSYYWMPFKLNQFSGSKQYYSSLTIWDPINGRDILGWEGYQDDELRNILYSFHSCINYWVNTHPEEMKAAKKKEQLVTLIKDYEILLEQEAKLEGFKQDVIESAKVWLKAD